MREIRMELQLDTSNSTAFTVTVQHDCGASVAEVIGNFNGEIRIWTGSAKVTPGDKFNREIANNLAVGRAFEKASRQLLRQGHGLVKCTDDNLAQSKASRLARDAITLPQDSTSSEYEPRHKKASKLLRSRFLR